MLMARRLLLLLILLCNSAFATDGKPKVISRFDAWTVVRMTDPMDDVTDCTAIYTRDRSVMMTRTRIFISMVGKGGYESAQFRFDKDLATGFWPRLETASSDYWWNGDMARIVNSSRLVVRIDPVVGSIKTFDIDLRQARSIQAVMASDRCQ